jgi:hypothetical protein
MIRKAIYLGSALLLGVFGITALAQQSQKPATPPQVSAAPAAPSANPADVSSPDAILAALYDVISGPAERPLDWNRFRSLFLSGARLVPTGTDPKGGERARSISPDDYASGAKPYFEKNGFFEKEVARKTDRFGGIMQIFSTYESRHAAADAQPFARGINSIQLFFDGTRCWIVSIFWQEENSATPLPKEFLPHGD